MQYTLRGIPSFLDTELRRRAGAEGKSLNTVAVEALIRGTGLGGVAAVRRDLGDIAGTWHDDPAVMAALAEHERIDEGLWR